MVYCLYAGTFWGNVLLPRFLPRHLLDKESSKYTCGFSNTPGPLKPFFYYDTNGEKIKTIQSTTYLILAGKVGLGIGAMSFCDTLKVTVTSDDNVMKEEDVNRLTALIEKNLTDEI
jgi:hypothetical protein